MQELPERVINCSSDSTYYCNTFFTLAVKEFTSKKISLFWLFYYLRLNCLFYIANSRHYWLFSAIKIPDYRNRWINRGINCYLLYSCAQKFVTKTTERRLTESAWWCNQLRMFMSILCVLYRLFEQLHRSWMRTTHSNCRSVQVWEVYNQYYRSG